MEDFAALLKSGHCADVVFLVGGEKIAARIVLHYTEPIIKRS